MRYRLLISISSAFLIGWYFIAPIATYKEGVTRNVSVTVVAEPFVDHYELVYRWKGTVYRSCPVDVSRKFIDSENVITSLTPTQYKSLPISGLGETELELTVKVPFSIASGPAIYQMAEIPRCSWIQKIWPIALNWPPVKFTVTRITGRPSL